MESPVRIFIGAAMIVNLLLLISTSVNSSPLPHESNSTTLKDEKTTKFNRVNTTWTAKNKPKTPDVALNELHSKDSTSEEHTEKNAKYKDRGRVKFLSQLKSSTESPLRRIKLSNDPKNVVSSNGEAMKLAQITDTGTIHSESSNKAGPEQLDQDDDEMSESVLAEDVDDDYDRYTSDKMRDVSFTIPGYNDNDPYKDKTYNQLKHDFSNFDKFSTLFSKDAYEPKDNENEDPYNSHSTFDFDADLTTPRNDFFDQKFHDISTSIMNNLASMKTKSPPLDTTNPQKIIKENVGIEKLSNGSPNNKSTVIIKNTKEIRLLDNEHAGTANKELSDVHGTSIYYEMSVLSTETYNITHSDDDDDCENDTLHIKTTVSTSLVEEEASLRATPPTILPVSSMPIPVSTLPSITYSSVNPTLFNTIIPMSISDIPVSTQNYLRSTERPVKVSTRNRNYSKRFNLTGNKDSPNSVTPLTDPTVTGQRLLTRKFYYTTPKIKPIWMAPRRNISKTYKTTYPTTIYAEHFNIKDKFTSTARPILTQKSVLTTMPSSIDPVLHGDVSGVEKVVHSQIITDNTIPTLSKRGSMKFTTSVPFTVVENGSVVESDTVTEISTVGETGIVSETSSTNENATAVTVTNTLDGIRDMEFPPTMTAWALASLRSPPVLSSAVMNVSRSTHKTIDQNELQKVSEFVDIKETTPVSQTSTTTSVGTLSNDVLTENITEIEQNKLPWKPITSGFDINVEKETGTKSERLPAESNISLQSSLNPSYTEELAQKTTEATTEIIKNNEVKPSWIPAMVDVTTGKMEKTENETIQPVDAKKSTGFESITKLPSGVTTPTDEINDTATQQSKIQTTTDYEITTIRFSYVPTEDTMETETPDKNQSSLSTTRTNKPITQYSPITTYRPKFVTTTEFSEETTTVTVDTTPQLEVSSQIVENATQQTAYFEDITTEQVTTNNPSTTVIVTTDLTTNCDDTTLHTTIETITEMTTRESRELSEDTTTTEILSTIIKTDSSSEENSDSNEVILPDTTKPPTTTITTPITTTTKITTTTEKPERTAVPSTTHQTTPVIDEITPRPNPNAVTSGQIEDTTMYTTEMITKSINDLEDLTSYAEDITTEASRVFTEEASSGAAIAIAVSTIGVIALVLLVGLLLVVRRRGRRGVYAQRCTPVSLDAYSLDSVSVGQRKGNHRLRASKRSYGNPAYDDEVTSHPMQYAALSNFALDVDSIYAEFAEIPSVSVPPEQVPTGCEDKNRYSNVLPLPETRVQLTRIGNDPTTEYINANYVTGPGNIRNYYILCQAPMANTVVDFWRMIWEQNSRVVVMLTEYMENGMEKCYEYLPPSEVSDNKRVFGDYQVILKKREQRDKYAISSVQLYNLSTRSWREVTHLWYFWPAKGLPEDYDSVIDFISEMRSYMKISQPAKEYDEDGVEVINGDQSKFSIHNLSKLRSDDNGSLNNMNVYSPAKAEELMRRANNLTIVKMKAASEVDGVRPCVCVCATGAGRSAALVALDTCARALAGGAADVPRVVRELRAQRPHAIANRHHYIFLYKVLSEYGNKLMGGGVDAL